jgi:L-ascorbate metabolism protein UlaG (beta-lactamase superfamily)
MHVTYLGHAAILVEAGGTRILMDPWLTDPTYHGTWWHYPPLELGVRDLPRIDYLYVSHEHPDHFDPPTLAQLDKNVHVVIANYKRKRFRDRIAALGFRRISEIDYETDFACGSEGLTVRLIGPDRPWDDSSILLRQNGTTVLNVNDCHLSESTLRRVGETHDIDLAFLTFTGASQYPGCFDFPLTSKIERALYSKHSHLEEFVNWARLLGTKRAVPAAGNHALLAEDQLFLNTPMYANTPADAVEALRSGAPEIEGLQMNPGDTWTPEGGHVRRRPAPDWSRRLEDIEELSRRVRARGAEYFASEAPAPPDLYELFRDYFNAQIAADPQTAPSINLCIWWTVSGQHGGDWVIDFRKPREWVSRGAPDEWNLHISIPDTLVYKGVSGAGVWDDIILSFRVRLARRPDRFMKEWWYWFSKL